MALKAGTVGINPDYVDKENRPLPDEDIIAEMVDTALNNIIEEASEGGT